MIPRWLIDDLLAFLDSKPMSLTCRKLAAALRTEINKGGA